MLSPVSWLGIIVLVVLLVMGIMFVVGIVLLIRLFTRKKGGSPSQVTEQDAAVNNTVKIPSPEEKKEILEMLARKEISKEEAERKLKELGDPVQQPQPEQAPSKNNKGCLIALIIGLVVLPLVLLVLFVLGFVCLKAC